MNKIRLFAGLCFSLCTIAAAAVQAEPVAEKAKAVAADLLQKFDSQRPFQAEYVLQNPSIRGQISLTCDTGQKYFLVKIVQKGIWTRTAYCVFDYSTANETNAEMTLLLAQRKRGQRCVVSMNDLATNLESPIGIFMRLAKEMPAEQKKNIGLPTISTAAPTLSMAMDPRKFIFSGGFSLIHSNLMVSWLDSDIVTNATNIIEGPASVRFMYPGNHVIEVDGKTGLLLRDSFLMKSGTREMVLQSQTPLHNSVPYNSLIPDFARIRFSDYPRKEVEAQLTDAFLANLGCQMMATHDFDEMLRTNSAAIVHAGREIGRQIARDTGITKLDPKRLPEFKEKVVIPAYRNYLRNPPVDIRDLSYSNTVSQMLALAGTNSLFLSQSDAQSMPLPPGLKAMKKEIQKHARKLPKNVQESFDKFDEILVPAVLEGGTLEFFTSNLNQIVNLPGLEAEEPFGYVNRGRGETERGDYAHAAEDFDMAIRLKPDLAQAFNGRGVLKYKKGDLDGAIVDHDQAIRFMPKLAAAYGDRGEAKEKKGDLDGAIADYNQVIKLAPDSARAYYDRGLAKEAKGDLKGALEDLNRSAKLSPMKYTLDEIVKVMKKMSNENPRSSP